MADQNPQIVMRSGPIPGSSYFLEKDEIYLGRDLSNDIPVPDPEISRRHARFIRKPEGTYLEDLGSTNGTFLNGVRINTPQLLKNGDLITLAENTVMSFEEAGTQPHNFAAASAQPAYSGEQMSQATVPPVTPVYQPVQVPSPQQPLAAAPTPQKIKKKMGWCSVVLLILLAALIVIGLVLLFMPASWWCALTFNSITGCPVY